MYGTAHIIMYRSKQNLWIKIIRFFLTFYRYAKKTNPNKITKKTSHFFHLSNFIQYIFFSSLEWQYYSTMACCSKQNKKKGRSINVLSEHQHNIGTVIMIPGSGRSARPPTVHHAFNRYSRSPRSPFLFSRQLHEQKPRSGQTTRRGTLQSEDGNIQ